MNSDLDDKILATIATNGPISRSALNMHSSGLREVFNLPGALSRLVKDGRIILVETGNDPVYAIPDQEPMDPDPQMQFTAWSIESTVNQAQHYGRMRDELMERGFTRDEALLIICAKG